MGQVSVTSPLMSIVQRHRADLNAVTRRAVPSGRTRLTFAPSPTRRVSPAASASVYSMSRFTARRRVEYVGMGMFCLTRGSAGDRPR
jgi:hypothetical protein